MLASGGPTLPRRAVPRHAHTKGSHGWRAGAARWSAAARPYALPAPHLLSRARAPARRSLAATAPRATVEGLFGAKSQRGAPRAAPAILPVRQPTVLELALSTELISATLSVPVALFAYRPLCEALGALMSGATVADNVLSYYVTLVGLLFGFIVSNTFYFLYLQQTELYDSIYVEASAVNRLLEEAECALMPADAQVIAYEVRRFLTDGAWAHQDDQLPAEILAMEINSDDDALENILKYLLAVTPAGGLNMVDTCRLLRDATVARLAASQRKIPTVQFFVCKVLAGLLLCIFPLLEAGTKEAAVSADIEAILFGALCGVVVLFLALVDDLADTHEGLYSVTPTRNTLQSALLAKTDFMLSGR
jgi:hypothetical protein